MIQLQLCIKIWKYKQSVNKLCGEDELTDSITNSNNLKLIGLRHDGFQFKVFGPADSCNANSMWMRNACLFIHFLFTLCFKWYTDSGPWLGLSNHGTRIFFAQIRPEYFCDLKVFNPSPTRNSQWVNSHTKVSKQAELFYIAKIRFPVTVSGFLNCLRIHVRLI